MKSLKMLISDLNDFVDYSLIDNQLGSYILIFKPVEFAQKPFCRLCSTLKKIEFRIIFNSKVQPIVIADIDFLYELAKIRIFQNKIVIVQMPQ